MYLHRSSLLSGDVWPREEPVYVWLCMFPLRGLLSHLWCVDRCVHMLPAPLNWDRGLVQQTWLCVGRPVLDSATVQWFHPNSANF